MTIKKTTKSGDILVKVDHNNLIYVDPNSVISEGIIKQREVQPENLVMYVNLEADLVPRTTLITADNSNTLVSIAKGTLNMMHNNGKDFDTTWTDAFLNISENKLKPGEYVQYDNSTQSFGFKSIDIKILGANFVPQIAIKFTDVRGKTLFESPENSPYNAFFHLPWPIFYLTVKGYYGKAIKYRLHLVKFTSALNSDSGDFDIDAVFVGSVYAYLSDIPYQGVLNAPYMYGLPVTNQNESFNTKTQEYTKVLKKTSRGYQTLKSVYQTYIQKGLLPENFPVKTLREIIVIARRLDKILEKEIFEKVISPNILSAIKYYEYWVTELWNAADAWKKKNLSSEVILNEKNEYAGNVLAGQEKSSTVTIVGKTQQGTLEFILNNHIVKLNANDAFGINRNTKLLKSDDIDIQPISLTKIQNINDFYTLKYDSRVAVNMNELMQRIADIQNDFVKKRDAVTKTITEKMNEIIESDVKDVGIGFKPTIRNIVGVICANAETYIRLMKDVHIKAFDSSKVRSELLNNVSTDSIGKDNIYPWPEVKKHSSSEKQNILTYPGSLDMIKMLRSNDTNIWPEVEFVEEFYNIITKQNDTLSEKEYTSNESFIFEDDSLTQRQKNLNSFTYLASIVPYYNKSISAILYEIWERAKVLTTYDSFDIESLTELAKVEFENIQDQLEADVDIINILSKINSIYQLSDSMSKFSPFERYPYFKDQLYTVDYIKETPDFEVKKYVKNTKINDTKESYENLKNFLFNYSSEEYRTNIYPFSSTEYKTYLENNTFGKEDLKLNGLLELNTSDSFINSPEDPKMWVLNENKTNIFTKFKIGSHNKYILNTPYFHKQLYTEFSNEKIVGKYAGSAYLLLNSLGFKDLDNTITSGGKTALMSSVFREIGATHYIPYHLMLKWGAIYHRYKKYIYDGVDILADITQKIDSDLFYDNDSGRTYTINSIAVNRTNYNNIGINPFYQTIYHQIVNDYSFFDQLSETGNDDYSTKVTNKYIIDNKQSLLGNIVWTSFIDNSKYESTGLTFTVLPSNGNLNYDDVSDYEGSEQENYRIIWTAQDKDIFDYSTYDFPTYDQYFKDISNTYSISNNNKKVLDLIAVFKPEILDEFESAFLEFSTENIKTEAGYRMFDFKQNSFQGMLKSISVVKKETSDDSLSVDNIIYKIIERQQQAIENLTNEILEPANLVKLTLSNPREINSNILGGFVNLDVVNFNPGTYDVSQLIPNENYIKLYLGEDIDSHYQNFFAVNNIMLNEENILNFRFIIYIYAGYVNAGNPNNSADFKQYLIDNIINKTSDSFNSRIHGQNQKMWHFLTELTKNFTKLKTDDTGRILDIKHGYNDDLMKLELYNYFKSFNDKWSSGNSIEDKPLFEEFLFLDKANKDIGDDVFINMQRLIDIDEQKNKSKLDFFTLINILIKNSGFDLRVLPAYVNFYGTNFNKSRKITPSSVLSQNLFGAFLDVDDEESSPKIILHYMGPTSKHLDMSEIKNNMNKYKNDGFDISDPHNNPIIVAPDVFRETDYSKSNKVVAFEVSFGDQNQSIFKNFAISQESLKNTTESFDVLERLGRSESGAAVAQLDIGLFEIYRQVSYTCEITCLGDVMIQPTMYFYLKNIPMFEGSYWITEVSHSIGSGRFETKFKGSRIPMLSLPDPKDSFMSSYRTLFDDLTNKATRLIKQASGEAIISGNTITDKNGNQYIIDKCGVEIPGESLYGAPYITDYGIHYNGYHEEKYIQRIKYKDDKEWLRSAVVLMGHPADNSISDDTMMSIASTYKDSTKVTWGDIKDLSNDMYFYSGRFESTDAATLYENFTKTVFFNPNNNETFTVEHKFDADNIANISGPINVRPKGNMYTISMSKKLMKKLGINKGEIIYYYLA